MGRPGQEVSRVECLAELARIIDSHADWWRFPEEGPIRGFLGTDPLFIVGDQPSISTWDSSHPNRRAFYTLLARLGESNAHVTDLYKRRGRSGALKAGLPSDFDIHLKFFRDDLAILRPTRIVALGAQAHKLLAQHVPEVLPILGQMWHFAYAVRFGRKSGWEANARLAFRGEASSVSDEAKASAPQSADLPTTQHARRRLGAPRRQSQRAIMSDLFVQHRGDTERIVSGYADAERNLEANRSSNTSKLAAEEYARALLNDGLRKGWLKR